MDELVLGGRASERAEAAPGRARPARGRPALFSVAGAALVLFFLLPVAALVWRGIGAPGFWASLRRPLVLDALRLTALTSAATLAVAVVAGTPLAYLLARRAFPGRRLVEIAVDLPLILPPVVAGVALLMAFGRRGLLGAELQLLGIDLPFTTAAVVLAQLFVAAPFYVRGARLGFQAVDRALEDAAAVDGASPWRVFRDVTLPLAWPGIASGAVLCWARAVSEFGATLMFAGNFPGRTQTMPLAIVTAIETDLDAALALAVLLVAVAAAVLLLSRALPRQGLPS